MIISAYSDGEKKDKIAEFYDTTYPCSFFRGLLTESQEQDKEVEITFTARQEYKRMTFKPIPEEQIRFMLNNPVISAGEDNE